MSYMRDKDVIHFCKHERIKLREYINNGVVRKLKNRDNWNNIWNERMSVPIFQAQSIKSPLEIPPELGFISKDTKQKYLKKTLQLSHLQK